ncbi:MAG: leucine-rich repeat protein, partial [Thomasclavelia spiroformis]
MKTKENKGVTLIALAVTIIIMLILAGVTISTLTGNSGISSNANQARIQNELAQYKEQMKLYLAEKKVENYDFFIESLNAGKESLIYDGKPDDEKGNIKTIIPNIADEYIECLQIINGELYIKTKDEKKIKAAQQLGIQVNPFDITDDGELLSTKANLKLINGEGTLALPSLVSKIGMGAFSGVEGLKTIIIPSSVKEIGDYAFSYNKEIERVVIEGDLKRIGHYAFDQATNLREINLPNSISEIGIFAFRNTQISEVTVPKNVQTISVLTFGNCSKLKKIVLQEGLKTIEGNAIGGPVELISLPSTVTSINAQAFIDCYNLINIDVSKNNNFIFESGKLYNKNRTEIVFITKKALANQNVFEINDGVEYFNTDISSYSGIKKLVIPASLKSISAKILPSSIENIEVKSGNTNFISENGILYNKNNGQLIVCYSKNTNVTIQEGIKSISSYAFKLSSGIKELTFPESLETISGHSLDYMY